MDGFYGYDDWKTACCGNYPHCDHCPYEEEVEEGEGED